MTVQKMAHAYEQDIAERDYAISSTQLELANAKRHIKVLEVQRSALSDDVESARTEYEVLVAQLAEEQDSGDALKHELSSLRRALQQAAQHNGRVGVVVLAPVSLDRSMLAAHSLVTSASRLSLHCGVGRAHGHHARVLVPRPPACDTERTRKSNVFAIRDEERRYQAPGVIHEVAVITGQQGFTAVVAHLTPVVMRAHVRAHVAPNFLSLVL